MQPISPASLPKPILDHIAAHNAHDIEAFLAPLAPDALVNDAKREFVGHAAIRAWAQKEIIDDKVTLEIESAFAQHGNHVVRCFVDGLFDKTNLPSPLILTYYVSVQGGKITQLIVILNKV